MNPSPDKKTFRNLVLIGFMTSGKSTQAKLLAKRWGWKLLDTDALVADAAGQTPAEIIANKGEQTLREFETRTVKNLTESGVTGCVISTGGGLAAREENWPYLRALGPVVALFIKPETAVYSQNHASHKVRRPLLEGNDPLGRARELLEKRRPFYERADIHVWTDGKNKDVVTAEILAAIGQSFACPDPVPGKV